MDVYYAPAWGRHYTSAPEGVTRWLTDAEEADLAARTTPERGLFAAASGDGPFDALIRPGTAPVPVRSGWADAVGAVAAPVTPVTRATPVSRPAPRRTGAVAVAVVAGTLGLVVGLVLGSAGVASGSQDSGARPVADVPAGR